MAKATGNLQVITDAMVKSVDTDENGKVIGISYVDKKTSTVHQLKAKAVILACGGFESNAAMRAQYLGPGWDLAHVRGTRYNTGLGIKMALDIGAMPYGHWSGCHAVGWDRNSPPFGDLAVGDQFQKHSYPWGIMLNADGKRFCDEGADFRNYTYAKYGAVILSQPQQFAWQIFDSKVLDKLRELGVDFESIIRDKGLTNAWNGTVETFRLAADLQPWVVWNGYPDGFLIPNHLAAQGFYLLRARTQLREISNILLK